MTVKQISAFIENEEGSLARFSDILWQNEVDMRALSIAEAGDFGIARIIVDDPYKTACVLKDAGYICTVTPVLALEIPDKPGGLGHILHILGNNHINVEYTYAFLSRKKDVAYMILRVTDNEKAAEVLTRHKIKIVAEEDLLRASL